MKQSPKPVIKIKFVGFWVGFDVQSNFITELLKKHYTLEFSDEPQYLFSSCFSDEYMDYDCVRIFYTGENFFPDFNMFDYAMGLDYLDMGDRYIRFNQFLLPQYRNDYEHMLRKHEQPLHALEQKEGFASMVVSSGRACAKQRDMIFDKLSEYQFVASGGRYRNNIGMPEGVPDKLEFQKKYKFALCFENCKHPGYLTEKLLQAFAAEAIPIYWGDPLADKVFSEKAFINCNKFESLDDVLMQVKAINENDELYLEMLRTPALLPASENLWDRQYKELEAWLVNIIEQPIDSAYRRSKVGFQHSYEEKMCDWRNVYRKKQRREHIINRIFRRK